MTATRDDSAAARLMPLLIAGMVISNLWHLLGGPDATFWGIVLSAAGFIWLGRRVVPASIARICGALALAGMLAWPFGGAGMHSLERGVYLGAMIASVMVTVSLLARAAQHSAGLQQLNSYLAVQSYRRRYVLLGLATQVLPCLLGFAGMHMLFSVAGRGSTANETERLALFTVITRGFSAVTLWSPTFGNMVVLLALYPQLRWAEVLPIGLGLAALTVLLSVVVDWRLFVGPDRVQETVPAEEPPPAVIATASRVLLAMLAFFGTVIVLAWQLALPVSGAIALLAPLAAIGLHMVLGRQQGRPVRLAWQQFQEDTRSLKAFAPEVLLFMAAGCGGSVLADSIPPAWVAAVADALHGHAALTILTLILCIIAVSCLGLNPILNVVVLASTFSPEMVGLPPLVLFCTMLSGWGIAAVLAPYSMLNMTAARYSGVGLYRISLLENWRFGVVAVTVATVGLSALA